METTGSAVDRQFIFITSDGSKPYFDPSTRALIRRQAMRETVVARKRMAEVSFPRYRLVYPPSSVPLDTLMPDSFSILNLAPLLGLRLGISTLSHFAQSVDEIAQVLSEGIPGSKRLLTYIPQRYGHVPSLTHATNCVVAQLRLIMDQGRGVAKTQHIVLRHHTKAVKAIQVALSSKTECLQAETLLAVQLLGVFDVCISSCF